jgi:4-amino-4-deoxy-L-arabinose transferase-like glycosyltransferase
MGVILLFLWGKRAYGTVQSGLLSGGILLTAHQYFFQARMAKTDSILCFLVILSLYSFHLGYGASGRRRYLFHGLSFFSTGLAVLTKGPIGLFIPLLVISIFLFKERRWGLWLSKEFILGYVIFGLTVLPWVFLFIDRVGFDRAITQVKEEQILRRAAPIYFYLVQIWGEFFPWSIFLPFIAVSVWRQREKIWHSEKSLFLIWFIALFVALTLFKYRASRYLLPAIPPLALMMGGLWKHRPSVFLILFVLSALIWHGIEFSWLRNDLSNSPGRVLAGELRPLIGDSTLFGYRLDEGTVEKMNFYLSRTIPILKEGERLSGQLKRRGRELVLMPQKVYEEVLHQEGGAIVLVGTFPYRKEWRCLHGRARRNQALG